MMRIYNTDVEQIIQLGIAFAGFTLAFYEGYKLFINENIIYEDSEIEIEDVNEVMDQIDQVNEILGIDIYHILGIDHNIDTDIMNQIVRENLNNYMIEPINLIDLDINPSPPYLTNTTLNEIWIHITDKYPDVNYSFTYISEIIDNNNLIAPSALEMANNIMNIMDNFI